MYTLPHGVTPPYITHALIGPMGVTIGTVHMGHVPGEYPKEFRRRKMPLGIYREHNGSVIYLYDPHPSVIPEMQKFIKRWPRPAFQEIYPRVGIYDNDSYWETSHKPLPMKIVENVTLLELLEILKKFAPKFGR